MSNMYHYQIYLLYIFAFDARQIAIHVSVLEIKVFAYLINKLSICFSLWKKGFYHTQSSCMKQQGKYFYHNCKIL
jgi:hypothetical protein